MNISFGIISHENNSSVQKIVESIKENNIPCFEIIVVGNIEPIDGVEIIHCPDLEVKNYITKKKNIFLAKAKYEIVVLLKDYVKLDINWYRGLVEYGSDWDVLMNVIKNDKHQRYLDWIWENPVLGEGRNVSYQVLSKNHPKMFVSGGLLIAKKYVTDEVKFDEKLVGLGKPTDVRWSKEALSKFRYTFNIKSTCLVFGKRGFKYKLFRRLCDCDLC
jgi:hypothetical protein